MFLFVLIKNLSLIDTQRIVGKYLVPGPSGTVFFHFRKFPVDFINMDKKKTLSQDTTSTSLEKPKEKWAFKRNTEQCNQSDSSTWTVFTENTTFHGVRYIFDKTFFILRR